jgi:hypothetical protein
MTGRTDHAIPVSDNGGFTFRIFPILQVPKIPWQKLEFASPPTRLVKGSMIPQRSPFALRNACLFRFLLQTPAPTEPGRIGWFCFSLAERPAS